MRSVNSRLPRRMGRLVQMFAARRCAKHYLSAKYEYKTQTIQRSDSLSWVSSFVIRLSSSEILQVFKFYHGGIQRGGGQVPGPPQLENHKLYWFLSGISNWTHHPPPPGNSLNPPPPWKILGPPFEPRKMIVFYESNRWYSVK